MQFYVLVRMKSSFSKYFFNNTEMKNSSEKKILAITIDNKLKFKSHVKNLCEKASQKIWTLPTLTNYSNDSEKS